MAQLRIWYGASWPAPVNSLVTRWWRDPWAFGSYSYASTSCTDKVGARYRPDERTAFRQPQVPAGGSTGGSVGSLWFAGEHASVIYPATMQGAYTTGQEAAAAIVAAGIPKLSSG